MDLIELFKWAVPWLQAGAWAGFLILAYFHVQNEKKYHQLREKFDILQETRTQDLLKITTVVLENTMTIQKNIEALEEHGKLLQPLFFRGQEK